MNLALDRRLFLQAISAWGVAAHMPTTPLTAQEQNLLTIKLLWVSWAFVAGSRGSALAEAFIANGAEIAYVCDVE